MAHPDPTTTPGALTAGARATLLVIDQLQTSAGEWGMPLPEGCLADAPRPDGGRSPCRQQTADGASFCPAHLEQLRDTPDRDRSHQ